MVANGFALAIGGECQLAERKELRYRIPVVIERGSAVDEVGARRLLSRV